MNNFSPMRRRIADITPWLWASVWFTLPVSMKATVVALALFGIAAAWTAFYYRPVITSARVLTMALFALYFIVHAASLLMDPGAQEVLKNLERKSSLVLIPLMVLLVTGLDRDLEKWAARGLITGLALTGAHLLAAAVLKIIQGEGTAGFTYHAFTAPYTSGAIYYSWYLSAALLYLAFRQPEHLLMKFRGALTLFFLVLLLLCASKLFIILVLPPVFWGYARKWRMSTQKYRYVLPAISLVLLAGGLVPLASRLSELKNTDLGVIHQQEFAYDTPFNGLTFRLLLWRFAGEILEEHDAWLTGTGVEGKQDLLNRHYLKYGVYTGNPDLGDTGYLGYNYHCQYLETLAGTGIIGLIALLALMTVVFVNKKGKLFFPYSFYLITIVFFLAESVLERQHGIVFFSLVWTIGGYNFRSGQG